MTSHQLLLRTFWLVYLNSAYFLRRNTAAEGFQSAKHPRVSVHILRWFLRQCNPVGLTGCFWLQAQLLRFRRIFEWSQLFRHDRMPARLNVNDTAHRNSSWHFCNTVVIPAKILVSLCNIRSATSVELQCKLLMITVLMKERPFRSLSTTYLLTLTCFLGLQKCLGIPKCLYRWQICHFCVVNFLTLITLYQSFNFLSLYCRVNAHIVHPGNVGTQNHTPILYQIY